MRSQQDSAGGLRHLITLEGLARDALTAILDRAERYRRLPGQPAYEGRELAGVTLANLFFEPSTRTRASFDLASRRLGRPCAQSDLHSSSRAKGESMLDTIYTLEAMNTDVFVIRDSEAGHARVPDRSCGPARVGDQRRRGAPFAPHARTARRADHSHAQAPLRRPQGRDRRRYQAFAGRAIGGDRAQHAGHHGSCAWSRRRRCCRKRPNFAARSASRASRTASPARTW